ncbi:MAG: hypothetical protein H0X39_05380 [Actinobacteria bacterium]|nr:hypothetical protein [Actinomycetota bacterium]
MSTIDFDGSETDAPTGSEGVTVERVPLGRLLVDAGILSSAQLEDALREGSTTGERLGEVVVRRQLASEDDVARLLADQWGLAYVERASIWFDADALTRLSREDAQRLEALPTRVEDGRVVVAVAEPTEQRLAALRGVIGEDTVVVVVPKTALETGLNSELLTSGGSRFDSESQPGRGDSVADLASGTLANGGPGGRPVELSATSSGPVSALSPAAASLSRPSPFSSSSPDSVPVPTKAAESTRIAPTSDSPMTALAESLVELLEANFSTRELQSVVDPHELETMQRRIVQLEGETRDLRSALAELGGHFRSISGLFESR